MLYPFRILLGGLCVSWILVSSVMAQDQSGAWRAGLGRAAITPTQPLWMAGYAARTGPSQGQVHDLWAKALVLEDSTGGRVLLLTLDLLGIDRSLSERVGQRLHDELGWERERVAICCSHTHSGPVVGDLLLGMYPLDMQQRQWTADYTRWLEDRLLDVARQATDSLEPMQVGWASGSCSFAVNRRNDPEGGYEGGGAMVYYGLPSPWQAGLEERICAGVERQAQAVKQERNRGLAYEIPMSGHDPRRLLYYLDEEGHEQPVVTPADWERRRVAIQRGMQQLMGPLPDRTVLCDLDMKEVGRESFSGYTRVQLTFAAEPGDRVSADLYLPEVADPLSRRPAVLALHQTSALGKRDVGIDGKPDRTYAHELALRGYIVLAPDYPSFGDLANYDFANDRYASGTMKGIFNHMRAVDLLVARDDVDPDRLAVIGHSLGGHNALFLAAFDTRLKVIVTSCGWTPFHFYYGGKKLENWAQDRYMPWMRDVFHNDPDQVPFDFHEVIAALAPRTLYSCSPLGDENFEVAGVQQVELAAREVYRLYSAEEELIIRYPETGHTFPNEQRQEAYQVIDRVLGRD